VADVGRESTISEIVIACAADLLRRPERGLARLARILK